MIRLKLTAPDQFPVIDPAGTMVGFVENVTCGGDRIAVRGWTIADEARLSSSGPPQNTSITNFAPVSRTPPDVEATQGSLNRFDLSLSTTDKAASLHFTVSGTTHIVQLRF